MTGPAKDRILSYCQIADLKPEKHRNEKKDFMYSRLRSRVGRLFHASCRHAQKLPGHTGRSRSAYRKQTRKKRSGKRRRHIPLL